MTITPTAVPNNIRSRTECIAVIVIKSDAIIASDGIFNAIDSHYCEKKMNKTYFMNKTFFSNKKEIFVFIIIIIITMIIRRKKTVSQQ